MLAGIREILVISTPDDLPQFQRLLGDGAELGHHLSLRASSRIPNGLAEAFIIGADHVGDDSAALVLGDNIFHGHGLAELLQREVADLDGCTLFGYPVQRPGAVRRRPRRTPTAGSSRSRRSRPGRSRTRPSPASTSTTTTWSTSPPG